MRSRRLVLALVAMGFLAAAGPVTAHHGWQLDRANVVTLKRTVTSFSFTNPHVHIYFDVKLADGNVEKWTAESASVTRLSRSGWTRDTLKPGDEITVTGYRARNGSQALFLTALSSAHGQTVRSYRNQ